MLNYSFIKEILIASGYLLSSPASGLPVMDARSQPDRIRSQKQICNQMPHLNNHLYYLPTYLPTYLSYRVHKFQRSDMLFS